MEQVKESDIQASICQYLELKRYFFWRQNVGGVFSNGHYRRMPKYSMTGVPDIILVKEGIMWGLEVKRPKGKISESQQIFKEKLEKAGGKYHIVTSIDDIIALGL